MSLRLAIRSLLKSPSFTLLLILVLALGIGANTAIFSVVNSVLLRPLEFRESDRIVALTSSWTKSGYRFGIVSGPDFHDWHDQSTAFSASAMYQADEATVLVGKTPELAGYAVVTSEFFAAMGVTPSLGRLLTADDFRKDAAPVVMVSNAFWRRYFGSATPDGTQQIRGAGKILSVAGVLPPGFRFPGETEIWVPTTLFGENPNRSGHNYRVVARLKPGVSLEQAQTQMSSIGARLAQAYPDSNKDEGVAVTRLQDFTVRNIRLVLWVLLGAVGIVLLIACANVANLLLARATVRTREMAIRAALGASRIQLTAQLLLEGLMLALLAGSAGLLLANWGVAALMALAPKGLPRFDEVSIDTGVLWFTLAASLAASFLFGLAPALRVSNIDPVESLRKGAGRGVVGGTTARLRNVFVVAQVALCVVLVISASLVARSLSTLLHADLGFNPESILTVDLNSASNGDADNQRLADGYFREVRTSAATLPGVRAAALTSSVPGDQGNRSSGSYLVEGQTMKDFTVSSPQAGFSIGSTDYFHVLGIRLLRGRDFTDRDDSAAPLATVVNDAFARAAFPGRDAVGRKIMCGMDEISMKWMTIIGVVSDARLDGAAQPSQPEIFMPALQHPSSAYLLLVKTAGDPSAISETVRHLSMSLNPEVAVRVATLESKLADQIASPRFTSLLLGLFAVLALALALVGIYAVVSYAVAQRTSEIGLRMALGAERAQVVRMVLTHALKLAAAGTVLGVGASLATTQALRSLLFGVTPTDPTTFALAPICLAAAAIVSSGLPAWRASRIEPIEALREE
jgi:putative ABC transport system permease protein